jgi:2-polyprenyl-3-methyl-5-hydroxy-6-metoxy-1,4-benzoquinol methylase
MPETTEARELFYERFADEFDSSMNRYEVNKRLALVFDRGLAHVPLAGREFLDAGCGTGLFSKTAADRGAQVTSLDVGERLLARVAEKCDSRRVVGDVQRLPFEDASFDVVLSTEVIEHVPEPALAVNELVRVLRPGGTLVVTTPNRAWHWSITIANKIGLRPYEGLENWVRWDDLRAWLEQAGIAIEQGVGFNAFPFVHPVTYPAVDWLDQFGKRPVGRRMINMMFVGTKVPGSGDAGG